MSEASDGRTRRQLTEHLLQLLRTSTEVPYGQHELQPGDARIRAAIDDVVLPLVHELAPDEVVRHRDGDVVARFGPPGEDGLLIQTYIVSQHGNLMADPHNAAIEDGAALGITGPVARGQGANQNKGPMASVLSGLAMRPGRLTKPVILAVNTEGRSSHDGSRRVIDDLGVRAAGGILAFATDLKVSVGNRGRVDVHIAVAGRSCHSSQPLLGINPIQRSADVVAALLQCRLPEEHPQLGPATLTPYQLVFEPIAPHTIPEVGRMLIDRRLLPGESPGAAVADLDRQLRGLLPFGVDVHAGATMLPADVSVDTPVVTCLLRQVRQAGRPAETMFSRNTFDAGYGCSKGIPTVMFGPGRRSFDKDVVAAEVVSIDDCWVAAKAFAGVMGDLCA